MEDLVRRLEAAVTRLEGLAEVQKDHETRIRSLEQYKWKLIGAAGAISVASGILFKFL